MPSTDPDYFRKRRARHRELGLCIFCKERALPGRSRCKQHYIEMSADSVPTDTARRLRKLREASQKRQRLQSLARAAQRIIGHYAK